MPSHTTNLPSPGAIAAVNAFTPRRDTYVRATLNCFGTENNLTDCTGAFQLISSCDPLGTASTVCLGVFYILEA